MSIYESYKKSYFTIADLYMLYALLNKPRVRNKIIRIIIVLFIIFMQNLYKKFYDNEKLIIFTSNKTLDSPIKQHATRQNLEHVVFERFEFIRSLLENISKLFRSETHYSIITSYQVYQA